MSLVRVPFIGSLSPKILVYETHHRQRAKSEEEGQGPRKDVEPMMMTAMMMMMMMHLDIDVECTRHKRISIMTNSK
jgi:hypothetical protein